MNSIQASEKQIFSKLKKGDREAFIEAYDLYVDEIYRFVYFKVSDQEEAQDLTSAVFLKAWNYIQENSLKDVKTLRALFYKIARTSVIDHYRKKSNFQNISIDNKDIPINIPDDKQNVLEKMKISSDVESVQAKLNELKGEYKEVIVLKFINELSIKEISNIVNKSNGNVRILIHRALKVLRDLMNN